MPAIQARKPALQRRRGSRAAVRRACKGPVRAALPGDGLIFVRKLAIAAGRGGKGLRMTAAMTGAGRA